MEIKNLKTQITYRIESKPDGGLIARSSDPAVPSIEAATPEELQEKIRVEAFGKVAAALPMLQGLFERQLKSAELIKGKTSSTIVVRSKDNETEVTELSGQEATDQFAKEFGGLVKKDFPELAQALTASAVTTEMSTGQGKEEPSLGAPSESENLVTSTPIVPEASNRWPFLILALSIVVSLIYFLFLRR